MLKIQSDVIEKDMCTGCGACYNSCPVNAISMKYDEEGFIFPHIDDKKCINCGLCERKCPECSNKWKNIVNPAQSRCFATMAENQIREKSSSGGMFTILAEYILSQNGYVCGAVYSDDYQYVKHTIINQKNEIWKLRGSKYVQSDTGNTYLEVKKILDRGEVVLYTGCPCQIAGLYTFLGDKYSNLFTIDLVCHGANSLLAYQSFINECALGRKIKEVNFRDKTKYGWSTPTTIYFEDGTMYDTPWDKSPFNKAFHGIMNRKSCGACNYATDLRVGDITLGDFWQVHKWDESCNDWKGTSLTIINNEKGKWLYDKIKDKLILEKEAPLDVAKPYNGQLCRPPKLVPGRKYFFHHLKRDGFHKSLWYGQKYRYDVGLIGWWFAANYGSVLTYYALGNILQDLDLLPIMIQIPKKDNTPWEPITQQNIEFMKRFFPVTKEREYGHLNECNQFCDSYLTGSDQLWVSNYIKDVGYTFFLDFADSKKKKIAYATSLGYDKFEGTYEECIMASAYLKDFDYVSVRETSGVKACSDSFGVEAVRMLDPVFLCDTKHYDSLIADSKYNEDNEEFLLCYILDPSTEKEEAILKVQNKLEVRKRVIFDMKTQDYCRSIWKSGDVLDNVSIEDFLCLIKKCKFLISDSHHGICFALIYQRNFICIANKGRGLTRFESLFDLLKIQKHMVYDASDILDSEYLLADIDYNSVNDIIIKEKMRSEEWLKEALEDQKVKTPNIMINLLERLNLLERKMSELKK